MAESCTSPEKRGSLIGRKNEPIDYVIQYTILAPFPLNKIHVEPQNMWCPNKDDTAYS